MIKSTGITIKRKFFEKFIFGKKYTAIKRNPVKWNKPPKQQNNENCQKRRLCISGIAHQQIAIVRACLIM